MPDTVPTANDPLRATRSREDVARALGISSRLLNFLVRGLPPQKRYREFEIKKRSGGTRIIRAPVLPLKLVQAEIAAFLDVYYHPRACVFGYVKDRNILMKASRHVERRWVLRVDLKDFFPTINFGRVRGMFLAPPFSLPAPAATALAQICCHRNELPQGSPASPVISNIICRGLDLSLAKLAREHRCTYTRYCDDLVFSTNRRAFPSSLAETSSPPSATAGAALAAEIIRAGFVINPAKVRLAGKSHRQMVTGIVTNARLNVPRSYIGDVRMLLHVWRKLGHDAAAEWYRSKHDKRNRPSGKEQPKFSLIVRGKLQYLGAVRGWNDAIYVRLAGKLAGLDPTFALTKRAPSNVASDLTLHVYVEGKTDKRHIDSALASLRTREGFADLKLQIEDKDRGSQDLLKLCKSFSERQQTAPCVFVFDSDERNVVSQVLDSNGDTKDWGNRVYSLVIAQPSHRRPAEPLCIELLYFEADLRRTDMDGRRLYLAAEFDTRTGRHLADSVYSTALHKSSLVVEDGVFSFDGEKRALSKSGFARLIQQQSAGVNFDGFVPLFEQLLSLRKRIADG